MSFRLFVYYCAVAGGWSGFIGWILSRFAPQSGTTFFTAILHTSIQGMFLGFAIALGLSLLDAVFSLSLQKPAKVAARVGMAVLVGIFGGLFGSFIGGSLFYLVRRIEWMPSLFGEICFILGWTIVGLLIGMSISASEMIASLMSQKDFGNALRKLIKCVIGGTVGGILGGLVADLLLYIAGKLSDKNVEYLWSPSAIGFIAIGASIGLLVGLAQIILKEAWIRVEAGFRPGRELLISKEKTSIGRAEGSDIALFGDNGVEKTHANIVLDNGRYFLEDLQTPGGSYVNDAKVASRAPLKAGDLIRIGKSVLRFNERAKRKD